MHPVKIAQPQCFPTGLHAGAADFEPTALATQEHALIECLGT